MKVMLFIREHSILKHVNNYINDWIGGFEFILKKMTPSNFNWFLHSMLFYHTQHVINKQMKTDEGDKEDAKSDDEI